MDHNLKWNARCNVSGDDTLKERENSDIFFFNQELELSLPSVLHSFLWPIELIFAER